MNDKVFLDALGAYLGEPAVDDLLEQLGVPVTPESDKGSDTAYIVDESKGVELAFTDEASLDPPAARDYPEGAWVLSSIRLHRVADSEDEEGMQLPFGLALGMPLSNVISQLGTDHDAFPEDNLYRWEKPGHCVFCDFEKGCLVELCITLPLPEDMR